MKKKEYNIGIVAFPICETGDIPEDARAGNIPFSNLADILHQLGGGLYVITGNKERVLFKQNELTRISEVQHRGGAGLISRVIGYIFTQLKLSLALARLSKRVQLWIFFIGAEGLVLPALTARLWRRRVVLALSGFPAKVSKEEKAPLFKMVDLLLKINLILADRVVVYSEGIIDEYNLDKYRHKISIAGEHFLDFNRFNIQRPLEQRDNLVAYIGRLSEGKGVPEFMEAISNITVSGGGINFLIGGDGLLRRSVENYLNEDNLTSRVKYTGWIAHDDLPKYLNEVKLLVLPSYTEALPNIVLEAMACGTPVLATAVGAIPDLIKDGETGFIMEDNSPDSIAGNIIRALEHPDLGRIAGSARALVESEYTRESAVVRWGKILEALNSKQNHRGRQ